MGQSMLSLSSESWNKKHVSSSLIVHFRYWKPFILFVIWGKMFRILSSITHPTLPLRTYSDLDLTNAEVSITDFREVHLVWIWAEQQLPKFDSQGGCIGFVGKSGPISKVVDIGGSLCTKVVDSLLGVTSGATGRLRRFYVGRSRSKMKAYIYWNLRNNE